MTIHVQDLIAIMLIVICINVLAVILASVWLHSYISDRMERMNRSHTRLRKRFDSFEDESRKMQILNPVVEEIAPPPMATPADAVDLGCEPVPVADDPATVHMPPTPYQTYLEANKSLWKLKVAGEDDTDYAEYLRGVMEECYVKLDLTERENVEREAADAWKYV